MTQPQDFNTFKIYSKVAEDLHKENPIVSYYLKTYTLNKALEYLKNERSQGKDVSDRTQEIKKWLLDLENCKVILDNQLSDKEHCKQIFKEFTQNLYQKSDSDYRNANYTRTLARDFLYVSVLFDAWELLGIQNPETKEKKNYSNQARFKIMEALTNGTIPQPQPQPVINQNQNQNQAQVQNPGQGQQETPKPTTTTTNVPPTKEKSEHEHAVDPTAKIDFDLTESIVVPQSSIDKYLGPNAKKPENHDLTKNKPVSDIHSNATQLNPNNTRWNIPVGKSMAFDENTPVINPYNPDQHFHPPTQQKNVPTVFYAPRQTPSIHQNLNQTSTPTAENIPQQQNKPEPEEMTETPGETGESRKMPNVSVISKKQESRHSPTNQETPQGPQQNTTFESTKSKVQETHHQSVVKPIEPENAFPESTKSKVQEIHQSIINPQTHQSGINPQPSHYESTRSKIQETHQSGINPQALQNLPSYNESTHSKIQETHQSIINPQTNQSVINPQVSQNLPSYKESTHSKIQEAHQSMIKPQSQVSQNLLPQNALLENAKPATSTFTYDQPESQSQHRQSINPNPNLMESKIPFPQESLGTQSIKKESVIPSNHQSVFPHQPFEKEEINQSKNLPSENVNPNLSSNIGGSDDKVLKCKGVKDICLKAIIDLNATNVKDARQKIQQALQILNEME